MVKSRCKTVAHINKYVILNQTINYNEPMIFKLLLFFIVNLNRPYHSFWVIRHFQNVSGKWPVHTDLKFSVIGSYHATGIWIGVRNSMKYRAFGVLNLSSIYSKYEPERYNRLWSTTTIMQQKLTKIKFPWAYLNINTSYDSTIARNTIQQNSTFSMVIVF